MGVRRLVEAEAVEQDALVRRGVVLFVRCPKEQLTS